MEIFLDIERHAFARYAYYLTDGSAGRAEPMAILGSVGECLSDADKEVEGAFPVVRICYQSYALGSYPTARLVSDPENLSNELMARVSALKDATEE